MIIAARLFTGAKTALRVPTTIDCSSLIESRKFRYLVSRVEELVRGITFE